MTCSELAGNIQTLAPELSPIDVARLSLMILMQSDGTDLLTDESKLISAWKNASFRLEAASDQHAAVADELSQLCDDGPIEFNPDQLWLLLRAVKIQGQILELYTDQPALA